MSSSPPAPRLTPTGLPPAGVSEISGWTVHHYREATSTNLIAAGFPAWSVVQADYQTAGRGRFQRSWIADEGGLWISAVVPLPTPFPPPLLPLLTGLAVCRALAGLDVRDLRLRWPNDVMIQERKLAGLLIDQFVPGLAVIGIGINITNHPEAKDPSLSAHVTRLADLITPPPLRDVLGAILSHLKAICLESQELGPDALLPNINQLWRLPSLVDVDLDGRVLRGHFEGVDQRGRLQVRDGNGHVEFFEPHQVRLLREVN